MNYFMTAGKEREYDLVKNTLGGTVPVKKVGW